MRPVEPVDVVELFPPLSRALLSLLRALAPADWARPTACAPWSVKDVAAHLLGGSLGRLWSRNAKAARPTPPAHDFRDLVARIDRNNALWVQAAERISPEMLIELLDLTDRRLYEHLSALPPDEPAGIAVAWAGDDVSPNWFDTAREYTEKWLHQQHIRAAVGAPLLIQREWLSPVLDTFVRALPHTFRDLGAAEGTSVSVEIEGEAGGVWSLVRAGGRWQLFVGGDPGAACRVHLHQDLAWRLFTRGISVAEARPQVRIEGPAALGERVLAMVSIMA